MLTGKFHGFDVEVHDPGIAVITGNQPERLNGHTPRVKRDLIEILAHAQMDNKIRVIVFTGSGRSFCAGDDITGVGRNYGDAQDIVAELQPANSSGGRQPINTYEFLRVFSQPLNLAIRNLDKLCIAAINGVAIQTGLSLALACDFRIASTEARMGSATLRFGYQPDEGGQYLLIQIIGVAKTMDFLMRNRIVSAQEALELGLVHEVVKPEELMDRTMELARELADGPQVAMRFLKKTIYNAADMTFHQALDDIASKTAVSDHHSDAEEGVKAWREKRAAHFNQWIEQQ